MNESNAKLFDADTANRIVVFNSPSLFFIEFRCVVTVSTPVVWLARENIKRLTPRPCINVEYSHGVVCMENTI